MSLKQLVKFCVDIITRYLAKQCPLRNKQKLTKRKGT